MLLTIEDFAIALLTRSPSIVLLDWKERLALASFVKRLPAVLQECQSEVVLYRFAAGQLNSQSFSQKLLAALENQETSRTCLLVMEIESITSIAAQILNDYRERLASFKAVVITIRYNRRQDFIMNCPDLMDWVNPSLVGYVEELGPPFTFADLEDSLKAFEERYQLSSGEFHQQYISGQMNHIVEAWFWEELFRIHQNLTENKRNANKTLG